ncbi:MAG: hypothetical protein PHI22_02990 [Bacilli bacterium]|nr:hypothetical protein [Bacilli bacterium]MDD4298350.1 hypothetical protein [Bacilli bacterium]
MVKRIFTITFVFLCALGLTGCETNAFNGGAKNYHKSPEVLFDRLCNLSENKSSYDEIIALVPAEGKAVIEKMDKNDWVKQFWVEKCTYTIESDPSEEEIKKVEKHYNDEYNTNHKILECKTAKFSFDDIETTEIGTCKFEDDKWYLIIG